MDLSERVYMRDAGLRNCAKRWFSFQQAVSSGADEAKCQAEHQLFVQALAEYEFTLEKAERARELSVGQQQRYEQQTKELQKELATLSEQNAALKQAYKQAKVARVNHQEYEKLAQLMSKYPSREDTEVQVGQLRQEIAALEKEQQELEGQLALKNGQFQLLLHAIWGLQNSSAEQQQQQQRMQQQQQQQRQQRQQQQQEQPNESKLEQLREYDGPEPMEEGEL